MMMPNFTELHDFSICEAVWNMDLLMHIMYLLRRHQVGVTYGKRARGNPDKKVTLLYIRVVSR